MHAGESMTSTFGYILGTYSGGGLIESSEFDSWGLSLRLKIALIGVLSS